MASPEYVEAANKMLADSMLEHGEGLEQWCRPMDVALVLGAFARVMVELVAIFELHGLTPDEVLEATRRAYTNLINTAGMSEDLAREQLRAGDTVPLTKEDNDRKRELEWATLKDLQNPGN